MASRASSPPQNYPEIVTEIEIETSPPPVLAAIEASSFTAAYASSSIATSSASDINASSSIAATATSGIGIDVFISHRGTDVKKTFASHLYRRLLSYEVQTFLHNEELQNGQEIAFHVKDAIRTASVCVAIFSRGYAQSVYCLNELLEMLDSKAQIIPVFYGVIRSNDLLVTGVYGQALSNLENMKTEEEKPLYDSILIQNWRKALSKVAAISGGFDLDACNGDEGWLIDQVVESVLRKVKKPALNVAKYPTGLEEKLKDFEDTVLLQEQKNGKPKVVGIVGLGGVGKTTLAKQFFNMKSSYYDKSCFLFDVRENANRDSLHILQRKLLKNLIQNDIHIESVDEGKMMFSKHPSSYNAFIVLDDVSEVYQLDAFLPVQIGLRSDSLILITSRNKDVLTQSGVEESSIYKLSGLNTQDSRKLFCIHSFNQPYPLPGFEHLVDKFLKACNGLPLSLKVFGALLHRKNVSYWEDQLDRLQRILPNEIQMMLQTSYDALHREEQEIFLDIACFFIGEERDMAIRVWEGSGWAGLVGFRNLQNRCLVEVTENNKIIMHDHLRDLGRQIVEASRILPSRIWRWTQYIDDILEQSSNAITTVRGIRIRSDDNSSQIPRYNWRSHEPIWNSVVKLFNKTPSGSDIKNLQILDTEGDLLEAILKRVRSPKLIWLRWYKCPYSSLPSWIPMKYLRVLEVRGNKLVFLWRSESQVPLQLRQLVSDSPLSKLPKSIGYLKHLELIVLQKSNLETLPEEFCHLLSLRRLELTNCSKLKSLPVAFGYLINLKYIDLSHSSHLQMLPDSFGNLIKLEYISLSHFLRLQMLPASFGNLIHLKYLNLSCCKNLTISTQTLGNISTLECIDLSHCPKIEKLPSQVAHQRSLQKLDLRGTNIKELPSAVRDLGDLELLWKEGALAEHHQLPSVTGGT